MRRAGVFCMKAAALAVAALTVSPAFAARVDFRMEDVNTLINVLRKTVVGSSTESETRNLIEPFRRFSAENAGDLPGVREISFTFYNANLRQKKLHTASAHLQIILLLQNGRLVEKSVHLFREGGCAASITQQVWRETAALDLVGNHDPDLPGRLIQGNKDDQGRFSLLTLREDSRMSVSQMSADWKIEVDYLRKVGGCADARELLPGLGHDPLAVYRP